MAIDAHHLTAHIDQWPARIAGVDGHIGLDEGQIVARVALLGTDNAGRDRVVQTKGRADGHDPFAHFEAVDVADFDHGQTSGLDLDHGHIAAFVHAHNAGLELALIGQSHQHLVSTVHHMGIGHDEAIGGQDEARTHATGLPLFLGLRSIGTLLARRVGLTGERLAKKAPKQLLHFFIGIAALGLAVAGFFEGPDVDHRRAHLLDQFGEIRQATHALGLHGRSRQHRPTQNTANQPSWGFRNSLQFNHHISPEFSNFVCGP